VSTTSAPPQIAVPSDVSRTRSINATPGLRDENRIAVMPRPGLAALPAETGVWVAVAAISMCFAALISALIVRQGIALDWVHFALPRILYVNTAILLLSSVSLEVSRRSFDRRLERGGKDLREPRSFDAAGTWLAISVALGALFVVGQIIAWRDLANVGLLLASSPSSSFFYLLTAAHGLHLFGGMVGLSYALYRIHSCAGTREKGVLSVAAVYWHFMDGLWVFLFIVLAART
jgi:cytochrome c oxidase subunit III